MLSRLTKEKIAIGFYLVIGSIGAIGQAILIRHELVDCLPYKIANPELYAYIANVGFFVAPAVAIISAILLVSEKRFWTTAIPVLLCPLVFLLVFDYFTWVNPNYDQNAMSTQGDFGIVKSSLEFVRFAFKLAVEGAIIGLISGGVTFTAKKFIFSKAPKEDLR